MFKKLNQYLLTHYPLLWNTKVLLVLPIMAVVHLFFFLRGWASVNTGTMHEYYYSYKGGLVAFSILCSIIVLIGWLIFYLRNNAFKSFYQIGKWHLTKEFALILLIVFVAITFFESHGYGERVKARSITGYAQLVQEVNTINLAKAFIPTEKNDYFVYNSCGYEGGNGVGYNAATDYEDTVNNDKRDSNFVRISKAVRQKNAYSYLHYCRVFATLDDTTSYHRSKNINGIVNNWVLNKHKDSILGIINQAMTICKKYDIEMELDPAVLADLPFADSNHAVSRLVKTSRYGSDMDASPYYLDSYALTSVFDYLDRCNNRNKSSDNRERLLMELYFALGIGILLLCYRRFSKKVFLISVIGAGVLCIVLGIVAAGTRSETGTGILYLFLFGMVTAIALTGLYSKSNKTVTGVLLNWHIYMTPIVLMTIALLIVSGYQDAPHLEGVYDREQHCIDYPIGCWVENNIELIAWANLLFSLLYTTFIFNRYTKKWHIMPDE